MVSESDRAYIRRKFASEPDPEQLSLLADETLDTMRDHRMLEPKDRRQSMRKARTYE